jgi:NAD(P)-dependent dehydrogenase (short-subunit alcohol dehydrogenase family)
MARFLGGSNGNGNGNGAHPPAAQPVVLVTGASSGIGKACADLLAASGCRVYGASRTAPEAEAGYPCLRMDVGDEGSVAEGVACMLEREGRIDATVNCAGFGIAGAVEETSIDEAKGQFDTNFFGVLRVCRAVLPSMRERRRGTIVNMSSIAGRVSLPFQAFYSASKFALEGMTEALRMEVRPFGIHVVLVEPGDTRTRFTVNRRKTAGSLCEASAYRAAFADAMGIVEVEEQAGVDPAPVARVVARVVRAAAPDLRYTVGPTMQRLAPLIRGVLPFSVYETLMRKHYGL